MTRIEVKELIEYFNDFPLYKLNKTTRIIIMFDLLKLKEEYQKHLEEVTYVKKIMFNGLDEEIKSHGKYMKKLKENISDEEKLELICKAESECANLLIIDKEISEIIKVLDVKEVTIEGFIKIDKISFLNELMTAGISLIGNDLTILQPLFL